MRGGKRSALLVVRISVVIPVRNEQQSIRPLLDRLTNQTLPPSEIVVADGGSTDGSAEIIARYQSVSVPIHLIRAGVSMPGRSRNLAAAKATSEWIAFIDAGVYPEMNWRECLAKPVRENAELDVVYGSYEPVTDSLLKECAAIAYVPPAFRLDGELIRPRSIACALMRRRVWEAVEGFPEHLRSAEDLLFMNKVEAAGFRIGYAPRAVVQWALQPSLWATFKRFVIYAQNNMRAGLWRQWQLPIFLRYGLLFVVALLSVFLFSYAGLLLPVVLWLLMFLLRAFVAIRRNRDCYPASIGRNLVRLGMLIPLLAVIDSATIAGTIRWISLDRSLPAEETASVGNGA